jgi:hypothetical protein
MIVNAPHARRNKAIEHLKVILSADECLGVSQLVDER